MNCVKQKINIINKKCKEDKIKFCEKYQSPAISCLLVHKSNISLSCIHALDTINSCIDHEESSFIAFFVLSLILCVFSYRCVKYCFNKQCKYNSSIEDENTTNEQQHYEQHINNTPKHIFTTPEENIPETSNEDDLPTYNDIVQ